MNSKIAQERIKNPTKRILFNHKNLTVQLELTCPSCLDNNLFQIEINNEDDTKNKNNIVIFDLHQIDQLQCTKQKCQRKTI